MNTNAIDPELLREALDDASEAPSDDKLSLVAKLVKHQTYLEDRKEDLEEMLKECNQELEAVRTRQLPDALLEAGCQAFETKDGLKVRLEKVCYVSIKKSDEPAAFDWFASNGHGGVIETSVLIPLGKGGHDTGKELVERLAKLNDVPEVKLSETIHWATLRALGKALIAENEEAGTPLPPEIIKLTPTNVSKIKRPT